MVCEYASGLQRASEGRVTGHKPVGLFCVSLGVSQRGSGCGDRILADVCALGDGAQGQEFLQLMAADPFWVPLTQ